MAASIIDTLRQMAGMPVRWGLVEPAATGVVNGALDSLQNRGPQLTETVRDICNRALSFEFPPYYFELIDALNITPSSLSEASLRTLYDRLEQLNFRDIRRISPSRVEALESQVIELKGRIAQLLLMISENPSEAGPEELELDSSSSNVSEAGSHLALEIQRELTLEIAQEDLLQDCRALKEAIQSLIENGTGVIPRTEATIEHAIHRIVQGALGSLGMRSTPPPIQQQPLPRPSSSTSSNAEASSSADVAEDGSGMPLASMIGRSQSLLQSVLLQGCNTLTIKALSGIAYLCLFAMRYITENNTTNTPLPAHIQRYMEGLEQSIRQGEWEPLKQAVEQSLTFLREQQLYFQGVRIPLNATRVNRSAIPELLHRIQACETLLPTTDSTSPTPPVISSAQIHEQAELLKQQCASYISVAMIMSNLLDTNVEGAFYQEIFTRPGRDSDQTQVQWIRQRFFAQIDGLPCGRMKKWIAKKSYDLLFPISQWYTNALVDNLLNTFLALVRNDPERNGNNQEFLIQIIRNWLAVTSGAYREVAFTSTENSHDLAGMLENALRHPNRNLGMTQQELYAAVIRTTLNHFGPKMRLSQSQHASREIPEDHPLHFFNPLLRALNAFTGTCYRGCIFLPERLGNLFLKGVSYVAGNYTELMQQFVENKIEALRHDSAASYATKLVAYHQLQYLKDVIVSRLREDSPSEEQNRRIPNEELRRIEITGLLQSALEVLNKSAYRTQDQLRNFFEHRPPLRDQLTQQLEATFLPEILECAVQTVSHSVDILTEENVMKKLFYDSLVAMNGSFAQRGTVTDEELARVKGGILELTDQILEIIISDAITRQFDFTNDRQNQALQQFVRVFRGSIDQIQGRLQTKVETLLSGDNTATNPTVTLSPYQEMCEEMRAFYRQQCDALSRADGTPCFHSTTKTRLNEMVSALLEQCAPLDRTLSQMQASNQHLAKREEVVNTIHSLSGVLNTFDQIRTQEDTSLIPSELQRHSATLRHLFQDLPESPPHANFLQSITQCTHSLISSFSLLQQEKHHQRTLAELQTHYETFATARRDAQNRIYPSFSLRRAQSTLGASILRLPENERLSLERILSQETNLRSTAEAQYQAFTQLVQTLQHQHQTQLEQIYVEIQSVGNRYSDLLATQRDEETALITRHRAELQEGLRETQTALGRLRRWSTELVDPVLWNVSPIDMSWLSDSVKHLAFQRAQRKRLAFLDLFHEHSHYTGFIDQVLFKPFLTHFGTS